MQKSKEYILCAANWYKDYPLVSEDHPHSRPYNVDRGIVLSGWRHANCIGQMHNLSGKKHSEIGEYVQGFLTNLNRFVDRVEGYAIAESAGQLNDRPHTSNYLFSEDLY